MRNRWELVEFGGIRWDVAEDANLPHEDHVEMSGQRVSLIVRYGIDRNRRLTKLERHVIWPGMRHDPKDVRGYLNRTFGGRRERYQPYDGAPFDPYVFAEDQPVDLRRVDEVTFDGTLLFRGSAGALEVVRILAPAENGAFAGEEVRIHNPSEALIALTVSLPERVERDYGTHGVYDIHAAWQLVDARGQIVEPLPGQAAVAITLGPSETLRLEGSYSAHCSEAGLPRHEILAPDFADLTFYGRESGATDGIEIETPDPVLDQFFSFARARATESIFQTRMGLVHSPGGGRYYGGVWANDQAEYAAPFFGLLGNSAATEATLNCYRIFASHTNPEFRRLPCSIEVEGDVLIQGADRGDAAMIAWGASQFALSNGDPQTASELWSLVEWCLEYCRRQRTPDGVIASDSDELEGRFSTGRTNLCTSTLTYGGLVYGARLARALGVGDPDAMEREAADLKVAINRFFSAEIAGFATYRYHEGSEALRAWICLPLVMGIFERKEGTLEALFSPRLWTPDGLATEAGDTTFWDRSTLYALQGVFYAGEPDLALAKLSAYAERRLLGDHVPYAVEAWPEGGQAHLAAESALVCRVFIDGMLGVRPLSLTGFELRPHLPTGWDRVVLHSVRAFGREFGVAVTRTETGWAAGITTEDRAIEVDGRWGEAAVIDFAQ